MASIEAMEALSGDILVWQEFCNSNQLQPVDLTFANLEGFDLSKRSFSTCDFSGARLQNANLDGAQFTACIFKGVNASNASMIECNFNLGTIETTTFDEAVLRRVRFSATKIHNVSGNRCRIEDVTFLDCTLDELVLADGVLGNVESYRSAIRGSSVTSSELHDCRVSDSRIDGLDFVSNDVTKCDFSEVTITGWHLHGGSLKSSSITDSRIREIAIDDVQVEGLDLTGSTIVGGDATQYGLSDAVLMHTAFVGCTWPEKFLKVNWWGRFVAHPALMAQPVQDVDGLPPIIRRDIADAQYLVAKRQHAGRIVRFLYFWWGLTSAYGQSMLRLTVFSLVLVTAHALGLLAAQHLLIGFHPHVSRLASAFDSAGLSFLGLSVQPAGKTTATINDIYLSVRVCGFLVLGIWVGIAANKVSKLSQ